MLHHVVKVNWLAFLRYKFTRTRLLKGHKNTEYFGIICRDNDVGYIGYVFKSQSEVVASEIIACLSLQFNACSEQKKKEKNQIFPCEMCPMLWFVDI